MIIGLHNPGEQNCNEGSCKDFFKWQDNSSPAYETWVTGGMNSGSNGFPCVYMDGSNNGKLEADFCNVMAETLCQFTCNVNDNAPRHCSALTRDIERDGNYAISKVMCQEEAIVMCQKGNIVQSTLHIVNTVCNRILFTIWRGSLYRVLTIWRVDCTSVYMRQMTLKA